MSFMKTELVTKEVVYREHKLVMLAERSLDSLSGNVYETDIGFIGKSLTGIYVINKLNKVVMSKDLEKRVSKFLNMIANAEEQANKQKGHTDTCCGGH